jgi:hypothetical protein
MHLPIKIGLPTLGGTLSTQGGLIFIAGTQDFYLRAFNSGNGEEIWKARLPVGSQGGPMTYVSPKTGKQYIVITAGGARQSTDRGDYVMAYACRKPCPCSGARPRRPWSGLARECLKDSSSVCHPQSHHPHPAVGPGQHHCPCRRDLLTRNTLTGDWGGLRHQLDEDGVKFTGDYSGETAYNAHGGLHRSARYSQNIKLGVQFDLSKLYGLDNGGKVQLTINDRRGNSASEDLVGNRLPIQENYGGLYTRLTELSYERTLFTPALNVKLGYMAMGNDLGGLDSGILCNFMNAGFCGHPLNMSGGSGWTNYPNAHLGVRVKYDLSPAWQLRVAAFNVDPESNGNSSRAWHLGPKHTTGTVVPIELVYKLPANCRANTSWAITTTAPT